jgi:hypothetical protein
VIDALLRMICPSPSPDGISDADVVANANAACEEIRRHIDHQSDDSSALDTKASALFTFATVVAGIVAARVHLDTPEGAAAGGITFVLALLSVWAAIQTVRPRENFSYGADPDALVGELERYPPSSILLSMAASLASARDLNVAFLDAKQRWYVWSLRLAFVAVVSLALDVQTGGIR